ncbi:helix-turn-helix domain-containing protein [Mycobacteroides abscessus]|uniref:helix-turn-helix domain-containing protein n=1 Tax=Mycobacteroides abscessus TaxID=36809 RepID=UPI0030802672
MCLLAAQACNLLACRLQRCHHLPMTTAEKVHGNDWVPTDTLAARVVVLRNALRMSRREFSQLTGLTENALQGIESGRSPHKLTEKIQAIHRATGASREWLMWGGRLATEGASSTVLTHE